jgi:hypothetical protein
MGVDQVFEVVHPGETSPKIDQNCDFRHTLYFAAYMTQKNVAQEDNRNDYPLG